MKQFVVKKALAVFILLLLSCNKSIDSSPNDDGASLIDYIDFFSMNNFRKGQIQKFPYKPSSLSGPEFSFYDGNKNQTDLSLSFFSNGTIYDLKCQKSDPGIVLGRVYAFTNSSSNTYFSATDFFTTNSKRATKFDIVFTKFSSPGRIEGNFNTYYNTTLWCTGSFKFTVN